MEVKSVIEFDGQEYEVKNPTIKMWATLNFLKDIEEEDDYNISLISLSTGIGEDKIKDANYFQVQQAAEYLANYFLNNTTGFYPEFEFKGTKYKFIDLNNMSFGEYVDVEEFLKKDISYRKGNMEQFLAIVYRPIDEEGRIEKYDSSKVQERAKLFKDLEVKYLTGALRFFLLLENELRAPIPYYLKMMLKLKKRLKHFLHIGGGMRQSYSWLMKTFQKLRK
jgi:hypothetical protein